MRIVTVWCCVVLAVVLAFGQDKETVYQVSTINALLQGLYDGQLSVEKLLKQGDFGLGTFDHLDGEMLVLDGVCYQIKSDGTVAVMPKTATTPFAAVTRFNADRTLKVEQPATLLELEKQIDAALPLANWFYAVKVTGTFTLVKARSVPAQQKPYPLLTEVVKTQPVFQLEKVQGTLVGFRCPAFVTGLNVPGYHFHFLSADRKAGGHVLDCRLESGTVTIDDTPRFLLQLPDDPAFGRADLTKDSPADLQKVEK